MNYNNEDDKYYKYKEHMNAGSLVGDVASPASSASFAPIAMFFSPSYYCCCLFLIIILFMGAT